MQARRAQPACEEPGQPPAPNPPQPAPPAPTEAPAPAAPASGTAVEDAPRTTPPRMPGLWHVVLLDDDDHTYEYVIRMMQELFAHPVERAFQIAQEVDEQGRAICMTTHKELAELKQEQVHAFGKDPLMSSSKGAMTAVLEKA